MHSVALRRVFVYRLRRMSAVCLLGKCVCMVWSMELERLLVRAAARSWMAVQVMGSCSCATLYWWVVVFTVCAEDLPCLVDSPRLRLRLRLRLSLFNV